MDEQLKEKGLKHDGIEILTNEKKYRVDLSQLTGGKKSQFMVKQKLQKI